MLTIANTLFSSRLLTGTGKFSDSDTMIAALQTTETVMTTMALRRIDVNSPQDPILMALKSLPNVAWLPNTSGAKSAKEAIFAAELLREALGTHWIKLEIHPDPQYLMPDPIETCKRSLPGLSTVSADNKRPDFTHKTPVTLLHLHYTLFSSHSF
jgi:thiazole synthase